jgi:hypothetical protein
VAKHHVAHTTTILHTSAARPVVVGLVLALLLAVVGLIRWRDDRWRRWAISLLLVAAVELVLILFVSRSRYLHLALPAGAVALGIAAFWLRRVSSASGGAEVPEAHRDQLKRLAVAYSTTVGYMSTAQGKQPVILEASFWDHFPKAGKALVCYDAALAKHEQAQQALRESLKGHDASLLAASQSIMRAIETDGSLFWKVDSGYLFLNGGFGIAPVASEADANAIKKPFDDLLEQARATPEGKALREAESRLRAAQQSAYALLDGIKALHVIRGKCDLC